MATFHEDEHQNSEIKTSTSATQLTTASLVQNNKQLAILSDRFTIMALNIKAPFPETEPQLYERVKRSAKSGEAGVVTRTTTKTSTSATVFATESDPATGKEFRMLLGLKKKQQKTTLMMTTSKSKKGSVEAAEEQDAEADSDADEKEEEGDGNGEDADDKNKKTLSHAVTDVIRSYTKVLDDYLAFSNATTSKLAPSEGVATTSTTTDAAHQSVQDFLQECFTKEASARTKLIKSRDEQTLSSAYLEGRVPVVDFSVAMQMFQKRQVFLFSFSPLPKLMRRLEHLAEVAQAYKMAHGRDLYRDQHLPLETPVKWHLRAMQLDEVPDMSKCILSWCTIRKCYVMLGFVPLLVEDNKSDDLSSSPSSSSLGLVVREVLCLRKFKGCSGKEEDVDKKRGWDIVGCFYERFRECSLSSKLPKDAIDFQYRMQSLCS